MNSDKPILELINDFLNEHQVSLGTKKKYRENLSVFVRWATCNVKDIGKMTLSDCVSYKQYLENNGRSPATVVAYVVCLRQFFIYLEDSGIYPNITKKLKASNKDQTFKRKPLRPDQVKQLLTSIDRSSLVGKRDYAIIGLMVRTGLRSVEVCRMDMGDFKIDEGQWIMVVQRKGAKEKSDIQGISTKVINPVKEYFDQRDQGESEPAFINHGYHTKDPRLDPKTISRIIKQRLRSIGINDPMLSCHSLRHTAAVTAIKEGTDIYHVQALMAHKDIRTTMIYLKVIEGETRKKGLAVTNIDKAY